MGGDIEPMRNQNIIGARYGTYGTMDFIRLRMVSDEEQERASLDKIKSKELQT